MVEIGLAIPETVDQAAAPVICAVATYYFRPDRKTSLKC